MGRGIALNFTLEHNKTIMNFKAKLILIVVLLLNIPLIAQNTFPVTGTVTAETDGTPIPGVSVLIVNTILMVLLQILTVILKLTSKVETN